MKERCYNSTHTDYHRYGARGITICDAWLEDFQYFLNDMGLRPKGTTIDRINNTKGYYPENCKWATPLEQANNRRSNKYITYNNITQTKSQWAKQLGFTRSGFNNRVKRLGITKAIESPKEKVTMLTFKNKTQSLTAWANELKIKHITLSKRISNGWSIKRALTT